MAKYKIAWLPGDGVGNDVMEAARIVLDAIQLDAEYIHGDIGWEFWKSEGTPLPERTVELIPEGTPLPTEKRGRFAYAYDNMTAVRVEITEGHGATRDEVTVIGEVILDHLPPRPRGTPIDVIYRYNTNQILEVDIIDVGTGASRSATRSIRGSLSEEKLRAARLLLERSQIV